MSVPLYNDTLQASSENSYAIPMLSKLIDTILNGLSAPEPARPDVWTAICPVCHDSARTIVVIRHPETRDVTVKCSSQGCSRADILTELGIDPNSPGLYQPKAQPLAFTPLAELEQIGDTPKNRASTLDAWFPKGGITDPEHDDPDWHAFLRHSIPGDPALYSKFINLLSEQMWPRESRESYIAALKIENPLIAAASPRAQTKTPVVVTLADVEPLDVEWLWPPYLAKSMVAMLDGDPGIGKSLFTIQLAAILSRGWNLPDQQGHPTLPTAPSSVLFLPAEDSQQHTIRPRLDRAKADVARIHIMTGYLGAEDEELAFTLQHIDVLRQAMAEYRPALVVIDPLQAYLGPIDMHRANETRPLMTALGRAAEDYHASILCVRHPAKPGAGGGKVIHRGLGSIDFIGAARTALFVESHPLDSDKVLLMQSKSNVGPKGRTQIFGKQDGQFTWCSVTRADAEVIAGGNRGPEPTSMLEVLFWLEKELESGIPQHSQDLISRLEEEGFKRGTIHRAKKALGVISLRAEDTWKWQLPTMNIAQPSSTITPKSSGSSTTSKTWGSSNSSIDLTSYEGTRGRSQEFEEFEDPQDPEDPQVFLAENNPEAVQENPLPSDDIPATGNKRYHYEV